MNNDSLSTTLYNAFRAGALAKGADEVMERRWTPGQVVEQHAHPFDAEAFVTAGEMWLTHGGQTQHLRAGDTFRIAANTPHDERYGPDGATYWVARHTPR